MLDAAPARRGRDFSLLTKSVSLDSGSVVNILFLNYIYLFVYFCQPQPPSSPEALKVDLAWIITGTFSAVAEGSGVSFPGLDAEDKCQAGAL